MGRKRRPAGRKTNAKTRPGGGNRPVATPLRIIGGSFRGRKLGYHGDPRTRPMKDRVREATFNLVGPSVKGKHAIDLFAGTGALGLEALSRGAAQATFIEQHYPTARTIRENAEMLGVTEVCQIVTADTFLWSQDEDPATDAPPWLVFCSPPYAFYQDRIDEMLALIGGCIDHAPAESVIVVESDTEFDHEQLPQPDRWDSRKYSPAIVGVLRV
jgi:16S rRNA (guanine966-N2)-methyltransferase